jgi:DNA-binding LytR/AlgR family response regulator
MKALIIEDEEIAAERLAAMVKSSGFEIEIVGVIDSVKNAVKYLSSNPLPDLMFLDIHLGDGISFQIFDKIKVTSPIIFTTAFDEYAIQAFKLRSIDYLLKPVRQQELIQAIEKFKSWKGSEASPTVDLTALYELIQKKEPEFKTRFSITIGQKIKTVNLEEVSFFFAEGNIVFLVTKSNQQFPIDYSLENLQKQLNPKDFFRINRQFLVRLDAIENVHIYPKSKLKLSLTPAVKEEVFVSVDKVVKFKEWLEG